MSSAVHTLYQHLAELEEEVSIWSAKDYTLLIVREQIRGIPVRFWCGTKTGRVRFEATLHVCCPLQGSRARAIESFIRRSAKETDFEFDVSAGGGVELSHYISDDLLTDPEAFKVAWESFKTGTIASFKTLVDLLDRV